MADMNGILEIERSDERREIVGLGIHVVAVPRLARTAMTAAVVGDTAVAVRSEKKTSGPRRRPRSVASRG
jgi:hypothetical protein